MEDALRHAPTRVPERPRAHAQQGIRSMLTARDAQRSTTVLQQTEAVHMSVRILAQAHQLARAIVGIL